MALKVILKADGREVILPVTPESVQAVIAMNIEKVNIHGLGDVAYYGERSAQSINIPFLIPSNERPYAFSGGYVGNTYGFIEQLQIWMKEKKKVRYIVGDTTINDEVLIQSVDYGETDGTRDLSGTISLQQTQTVQVSAGSGSRADEETSTQQPKTRTIRSKRAIPFGTLPNSTTATRRNAGSWPNITELKMQI